MDNRTNLAPYELQLKSEEIREKIMDIHKHTGRLHIGSSLSCIEILTTLYYGIMKPEDKIILSKGHASSALYTILIERGVIPEKDLPQLEGHPEFNPEYNIWATTGSLGHGLSIGAGMAYSDKRQNVFVVLGDGECDEGQVWEAARLASDISLRNLLAIVDCNGFQGFKSADYSKLIRKFSAFGWESKMCDGHNCEELMNSFRSSRESLLVILAETIKGKGIPEVEGTMKSHYFSPPKEQS